MKAALLCAVAMILAGSVMADEAIDMGKRQARQTEIDYYVQRYDGADVALDKFNCVKPAIPARSETAADTKLVGAGIDAWMVCYNRFIKNLQTLLPAGKAIPDDLADLMTDAEIQQAVKRMDLAYAAVHADARSQADQLMAARRAWQTGSSEYASTENARLKQILLVGEQEARTKMSSALGSAPLPAKH
jgi:hypothetical protein